MVYTSAVGGAIVSWGQPRPALVGARLPNRAYFRHLAFIIPRAELGAGGNGVC